MEPANATAFVSPDDTNPAPSNVDDSPILPASDHSKEAEIFLEKEGGKIHQIFDTENKCLQQRSPTTTHNGFEQSIDIHAKQFLVVMESYQASKTDPSISALDLRGKHSWDDVLQVVKDAEAAYEVAGRKGLRKALSLIGQRREKVLKTLLRIPEVIIQAEQCRENFPSDEILYDKAAKLYIAALTAIEGTTAWLKRTSVRKQRCALLLGPLYNKSFEEKILALDEALAVLQERVSILRDAVVVRTGKVVESVQTVVKEVEKTGGNLDFTTKATLKHVQKLVESQDETHVKIDNIHNRELQEAKEEAKKAMKIVLEETTKTSQWMKQKDRVISRLRRQIDRLERAAASLSLDELLDILDVSAGSPIQDLQRMIRAGQSTDLSADHIAKGIIGARIFTDWLSAGDSAALFIESRSSLDYYGRNTPMSIMSSTVIEFFGDKEPAVAIHFFCAPHISSNDAMRGPHGMMRSLICQTLRLFPVDLDFISSRRYSEQLHILDFLTLCDCFVKIMKRLPADAVLICIIDSICFFENKEWAENCRKAVNDLQDLVYDDELSPIFKLLITSPLRSRYVADTFAPECRMLLQGDDSTGRRGPTERQISMGTQRFAKPKESDLLQSLRAKSGPDSEMEELWDDLSDSDADLDSNIE